MVPKVFEPLKFCIMEEVKEVKIMNDAETNQTASVPAALNILQVRLHITDN